MIQDIYHHKMEVVYDGEAVLGENDYIIAFQGRNVYMKKQKDETSGAFLTCEDILPVEYRKEAMEKFRRYAIYLLCLDGRRLFLLPEKYLSSCPQAQQKDINIFREKNEEGRPVSFAMITAWHLYRWYEETKFCGACGVRLRHGQKERTMVCPICGNVIYPRIYPAIIAGIYDDNRLLLTKMSPDARYYALVSGYCEVGETVEDTVRREVMEETGLSVKDIRYYKSQPWASSQSILSGFFARLDGDSHIHIDERELCEARWVKRDKLEDCYSKNGVSLTAEMMEYFQKHPEEFEIKRMDTSEE